MKIILIFFIKDKKIANILQKKEIITAEKENEDQMLLKLKELHEKKNKVTELAYQF